MFGRLTSSRRSISKEVSMGLILAILLVSTISFFIAYSVARAKAHEHLNAKADEYIQYLKEILVLPIWNYDYEAIEAIGKSFMQNDYIAGITIVDSRDKICVAEKKRNIVPIVKRSAKPTYFGEPIGAVEITLASGYFNIWTRQLFWYISFIILINLLSLILLTGLFMRRSLNKPLRQLDELVTSYNAGHSKFPRQEIPYVELRSFVETLQRMGQQIDDQMSAIQQAEKKYRSIFENAMEGIFQSTMEGRIISANPAFAQILGYDSPESLMENVTDIARQHYVDPEQRRVFTRKLLDEKVVSGYEVMYFQRNGEKIWISINARPIYDDRGHLMYLEGLVQDITLRKKTEARLRQLSTAVEQVADSIMITDRLGQITYVNPAFESSRGFALSELVDQHPDVLGVDAREISVYEEIWKTVNSGDTWTGRMVSRKKDGGTVIEDATVSPIKGDTGRFLGYVAVNRDVTEKAKIENQLRQSQKMESVGTLAGGIAHDFNNILGVIIGCSELVLQNMPDGANPRKDMETVLEAALRAKSLVSQILTFSRQREGELRPLVLAPLVKEVTKFLRATLLVIIEMRVDTQGSEGAVLADPIQIQQIVMNLCTNAAHAMGAEGGELNISLSDLDLDRDAVSRIPELSAGPYVKLSVADTGCGIPKELLHRIFDPFFTTKKVGEGTGLGLSVVHGIVKKLSGAVFVDSTVNRGTVFTVFLPRLDHPDIEITAEQVSELPTGEERILLVDDEAVLAAILQRILSGLGYHVETRTRGAKALERFRDHPHRYDLLVADHTMPGMTGTLLIEAVRKIRPDLPVILCTGLKDRRMEIAAEAVGVDRMLVKPIRRDELALSIREVLDGHRE